MTPCTAAHQASLSFTISWSLLKLMSIELVTPSNHLIFCHPLLLSPQSFPASGSFPLSRLFASGGRSIGTSASASVLPVNNQGWFPLGLTGLISLLSKGLSSVSHWLFKILETGKIQLPLQKIKLCVVSCHLQIGFYFFFSDLDSFYFFFFSNCCS